MSEPRRIACPFADRCTHDIVQAFFFDYVMDAGGKLAEPNTVVTVPAHANDIFGGKDIQSGLWTQDEFKKRFKIAQV